MSAEVTAIVREATAGSRVRRSRVRTSRFDFTGGDFGNRISAGAPDLTCRRAPVGL